MRHINGQTIFNYIKSHEITAFLQNLGYKIEEETDGYFVRFIRFHHNPREIEKHILTISFPFSELKPLVTADREYYKKSGNHEVNDFRFPTSDLDEILAYFKKHEGEYLPLKVLNEDGL